MDIFYLHAADRSVPFDETLEEVNKLHKEGRFVNLGLSNFTAFEVAEIVILCKERGWVRPTIYQGMYNAISESSLLQSTVRYIDDLQLGLSRQSLFHVVSAMVSMSLPTILSPEAFFPERSGPRIFQQKDVTAMSTPHKVRITERAISKTRRLKHFVLSSPLQRNTT